MLKMPDLTLQKAAAKAYQAEVVARMLENYPHKLTDSDVEAAASLWQILLVRWLLTLLRKSQKPSLRNNKYFYYRSNPGDSHNQIKVNHD
jgi:hypothetical protein